MGYRLLAIDLYDAGGGTFFNCIATRRNLADSTITQNIRLPSCRMADSILCHCHFHFGNCKLVCEFATDDKQPNVVVIKPDRRTATSSGQTIYAHCRRDGFQPHGLTAWVVPATQYNPIFVLTESKMSTLVLGIETSCDETGIGLVDSQAGVVGEALFSQVEIHREYGGVVPELASRDHIRKLLPLLDKALGHYQLTQVDAIAYTAGPGLIGALLTGAVFGYSLAWALNKPALGIHHLEAHILACMLENPTLQPPYLALLVSGGHTQLVEVLGLGNYRLLGDTLDDAVGEAFDKVAKMLALPYPGGPAISKLADHGSLGAFKFTSPMVDKPGLDFSFSGLKTQVMNQISKCPNDKQSRADIALAFEIAAVNALIAKSKRALAQNTYQQFVVAGGVAANRRLRRKLRELAQDSAVNVIYPPPSLCMDNGVMIAYAGMLRQCAGQRADLLPQVRARWPLSELQPLVAH